MSGPKGGGVAGGGVEDTAQWGASAPNEMGGVCGMCGGENEIYIEFS